MADEIGYTLGPKAIEQIKQLIRESRSTYANPEGHRARWLRTANASRPCANYYIFIVEGGPTAGTVGWSVIDLTDDSTVASGTYTMGDAASTLTTAINTALGFTVPISGGPLPDNEITLNLNRGRSDTRYEFRITSQSLTPQTDGFAYAKVAACCVVGG